MAEATKIALQGYSRVKIFPILKNSTSEYAVGEGMDLPWAQEMTKEADTSESKIYGDDMLYLNLTSWNGLNSTITLIEMPLKMFEVLGFGTYDDAKEELKVNPQGMNKEFAMTFRCQRADGKYRMFKMFSFTINELKESAIKSKGEGADISPYQAVGTFTKRKVDDLAYMIHDGADIEWLDTVEAVTKT